MNRESASHVLREEHQRILQVVNVLEDRLDDMGLGNEPDFDVLADCVTFFRLFADACHHGKEEDLLFPELENAGMPRDTGPIAVMLEEHRQGRWLVAGMAKALPGARAGDAGERTAFDRHGRGYIDMIRAHIAKEDNVLFNMADQLVAGPSCRQLCTSYEEADGCLFEQRTKAQLEALAEKLAGA